MAFSQQFLDELASRNDIVDVVSSYVALTKKGGNYFGLCPFHNERTGSFSVSQDKQMYYCFGCRKGGGVVNFIMEIENLGFRDAVELLAKRVHMLKGVTGNLSITPLFTGYEKMLRLLRDGCVKEAKIEFERILPIQAQILDCIKQ